MKKIRFYALKLPLMLVLICIGYILDFLTQLPFVVMCAAGSRRPRIPVASRPAQEKKQAANTHQ